MGAVCFWIWLLSHFASWQRRHISHIYINHKHTHCLLLLHFLSLFHIQRPILCHVFRFFAFLMGPILSSRPPIHLKFPSTKYYQFIYFFFILACSFTVISSKYWHRVCLRARKILWCVCVYKLVFRVFNWELMIVNRWPIALVFWIPILFLRWFDSIFVFVLYRLLEIVLLNTYYYYKCVHNILVEYKRSLFKNENPNQLTQFQLHNGNDYNSDQPQQKRENVCVGV